MYVALGATASELVPPEISGLWPDQARYSAGLIKAVDAVADQASLSFDEGGVLNPPIMSQVTALRAALEATTGVGLDQLVSLASNVASLANATDVASVTAAVSDLLNTGLEVGTGIAEAAGAASDVMSVVPIIGGFISAVAGIAMDLAGASERYDKYGDECQRQVDKERNTVCARLVKEARPVPTAKYPLPADFFRPVFYAWKLQRARLPLTPASLYVALTAGENQGMWGTRGHVLTQHVPAIVKRKMWSLIVGIMESVEEPGIKAFPTSPGDGGRALYPILQDIVRNMWIADPPGFTELLRGLEAEILGQYDKYKECPELASGDMAAGAMPAGSASCRSRVDLVVPFEDGLIGYQNALFEEFWDADTKSWKMTGNSRRPAGGVLLMQGAALSNLMRGADDVSLASAIGTAFAPLVMPWFQKALVVLGAAGFGYAVYTALRQFGPRRA